MAALVARCLHNSNCIRSSTKSILLGAMIYIYWTFDVTGLLHSTYKRKELVSFQFSSILIQIYCNGYKVRTLSRRDCSPFWCTRVGCC